MAKIKLTLSIDEETVRQAKSKIATEDKNMSEVVEEFLKALSGPFSMELEALGLKPRYVSFEEVIKKRKKGLDSAKIVRELRDERAKHISGY